MNHKTLPKGYRRLEVLDFMRSRKQMRTVAFGGLAAIVLMLVPALFLHPFAPTWV